MFANVAFAANNSNGYNIQPPSYESDIALLVNADTDTVIYSKNADKKTKKLVDIIKSFSPEN